MNGTRLLHRTSTHSCVSPFCSRPEQNPLYRGIPIREMGWQGQSRFENIPKGQFPILDKGVDPAKDENHDDETSVGFRKNEEGKMVGFEINGKKKMGRKIAAGKKGRKMERKG